MLVKKKIVVLGILFMVVLGLMPTEVFAEDVTAPELVEFDLEPNSIDVTHGPATVTFTIKITDDLSGFDNGYFTIQSPSGGQTQHVFFYSSDVIDEVNDIYQISKEFQQFAEAGQWRIPYMRLRDKTTNQRYYYEQELIDLGFPTKIDVNSVQDTNAPELASLEVEPNGINVNTAQNTITFTMKITDDLSGFDYGRLYLTSPSGGQQHWFPIDPVHIIDEVNDIYQLHRQLPQYCESGTWNVSRISLTDNASNRREYYNVDMIGLGFSTGVEVTSEPEDVNAPVFADFNCVPSVINTTEGPDTATFTLRIMDDLSGVKNYYSGSCIVKSPSGKQTHWLYFPTFNGTQTDVNAEIIKEFPQYSEFGEWYVTQVQIDDNVLNRRFYNKHDIDNLGFDTTFLMDGSSADGSVTVPVTASTGGTVVTPDGALDINIPAGALAEDTTISVTQLLKHDPTVDILIGPDPELGTSVATYNFEPDGLVFNGPVTITMIADVTALTPEQRGQINLYIRTDTNNDGTEDTFVPIPEGDVLENSIVEDPAGVFTLTFRALLDHFSIYALVAPVDPSADDTTPPEVTIAVPQSGDALQDCVTLSAEVDDESDIKSVHFLLLDPANYDFNTPPVSYEAVYDSNSDSWIYDCFDTTTLPDGYYILTARAVDAYDNEGISEDVPFSIRNWAVLELLPASKEYRAGRTMPIKFSLRVAEIVDSAMPFVYNEELEIQIYKSSDPNDILQASLFGDKSTDYRINSDAEHYITNFKTAKEPAEYTVEIWKIANDFFIDSFTFETSRK